MLQARKEEIQTKVRECIAIAEAKYGVTMPAVCVRFDLTGKTAGMACRRGVYYYLRFNTKHIELGGRTWEHLLNDTVPHEVAHTLCQAFKQFGNSHDAGWKSVCLALGGTGARTYGEKDAPEAIALMFPYVYITSVGNTVRVTKLNHSKVQDRGARLMFKGGLGSVTKDSAFRYAPTVAPVAGTVLPPVAAVSPAGRRAQSTRVATQGTGSKAAQVRARIVAAKVQGLGPTVVAAWAVAALGMTPGLAATYVKNNWDKV